MMKLIVDANLISFKVPEYKVCVKCLLPVSTELRKTKKVQTNT